MSHDIIGGAVPRQTGVPLLQVEDLQVEFRTRDGVAKAVNGVSYSLEAGRTLAVLGESGSARASPRRRSWASWTARPASSPAGGCSWRAPTC
jgi:ABC-type microcin C transport system duplicated ATPase subunit YejF